MQYPVETFHLTKWKPITHADYVKMIGEISLAELGTEGAVTEDQVRIETSLQEGATGSQFCLVTTAPVVVYDPAVDDHARVIHDAFLMIIFDPETTKTLCFVRSDVRLADG